MTTQISDIHDLLRLLDARPDLAVELRQRILTHELLAMPERLAQLTVRVDQLTEQMTQLTVRMDELTAEVKEFIQEQQETNRRVDARLARIEATQDEAKEELAQIKGQVGSMQSQTNTMQGQVGNLLGDRYERRLNRRLSSILYSRCQLDNCEILQNADAGLPSDLLNTLRAQQRNQVITIEQLDQLTEADFIVRGSGITDNAQCYVVIEASITLEERDIVRARERADILAMATQTDTVAIAIAETIHPPQDQKATTHGVTLLRVNAA